MTSLSDTFTAEEIARASGVPREAVDALITSGNLRAIAGTPFFAAAEAIRGGRQARDVAQRLADTRYRVEQDLFGITSHRPPALGRRRGPPTLAASFVHAALVILLIWVASRPTETAPASAAPLSRLVFLALPGSGGGGGGGGLRNPLPAAQAEHKAPPLARPVPAVSPEKVLLTAHPIEIAKPIRAASRPEPVAKPLDPIPSRVLIAPVAASGRERERQGDIASDRTTASAGAGTDGGAGAGRGLGNGAGTGAGIGPGSGGGTGGGPFRPGSGIEPPRLLKEVKAVYTDDARRRGLTGDVVLEIVVKRDGSVDDVSVIRGLGAGLEERAIAAVRQWRFAPARRAGEAVDVIVEVAVEFSLR